MHSGSAGSRITVRTYPGQTKAIWNFQTEGNSFQLSYWDFRDLDFRTDGCGFRMGYNGWGGGHSPSQGGAVDGSADHIRFIDIVGTRTAGGVLDTKTTDNRGIITAAWGNSNANTASFIGIYRSTFTGPTGEGIGNQSLIWLDYMQDVEIVGNLFLNSAIPIYFKHTQVTGFNSTNNAYIRNNIFRNCDRAQESSVNGSTWTNNAFDACKLGFDEDGGSPPFSGSDNVISHNTFLNSDWLGPDFSMRCSNNTATNNVMVGTSRWADSPFSANSNGNVIDYSAVAGTGTNHYYRNSTQYTMAGYKVAFSANEANGVAGTLTLVGGGSPGSTPANWALSGGTTGTGNASDGGDRGVDATKLLTATTADVLYTTDAIVQPNPLNLDQQRKFLARYHGVEPANDYAFRLRASR
jgi:hypothetical protein